MLNLTPHTITVVNTLTGQRHEFKPSGTIARVSCTNQVMGVCPFTGVQITQKVYGEVTGLPPEGTPCLVSAMVLDRVKGRAGVFAPDTFDGVIRNEKGLIDAVTKLNAA